MTKGIYKISCSQETLVYIGSSININRRWAEHRRRLNTNTHHCEDLQLAWNAYGEDSFIFEIVEETDDIIRAEQHWLNKFWPNCYNTSPKAWNPMRNPRVIEKQVTSLRKSQKRGGQKLSETQIPEIVDKLNKGITAKDIATEYGVSVSLIQQIRSGSRWTHITKNLTINKQIRTTESQGREMRIRFEKGETIISIARSFGVSRNTVKKWLKTD